MSTPSFRLSTNEQVLDGDHRWLLFRPLLTEGQGHHL
jgi:hypothetical protein